MKMNENELCDDLPDEEEFEDDEDYNYNDEEEYMGEDEEEEEDDEESEPEENDVDMREKKRIKNAFEDDEAEEEDMVDDEDDDDDSIALEEFSKKKLSFKKIQENPELLSETSCASDVFKAESVRNEMETPTIANRTPLTSAPNSNSSTLQLPRSV